MDKRILTGAEKEKLLKKICKKELMWAWYWGAAHAREELGLPWDPKPDPNLEPFRRFRRTLPRDLTMALKKAGLLPL